MHSEFIGSNAVIVARQFNPSVFSQLWLVDNELVRRDDFASECVFSPLLTSVTCSRFKLLVVPEQLQFFPTVSESEEQELIQDVLVRIVRLLPHTPFVAAGLNFAWRVFSVEEHRGRVSRELFFRDGSALYSNFDTQDAAFGALLSKGVFGCRLNLSVKPIITPGVPKEDLEFMFNYHREFGDNTKSADSIEEFLNHWAPARAEAEKVLASVQH